MSGLKWRYRQFMDAFREYCLRLVLRQTVSRCKTNPCVSVHGNFENLAESKLLKNAFEESMRGIAKLPSWVCNLDGMSGQKYRSFINNLIASHPNPHYLEIGSWRGSTAVAAVYGNSVRAVCIDNWSEFGGPKKEFISNMEKVDSPHVVFRAIENDFRRVNYASLEPFNVYFFDGPHSEADQFDAIAVVRPALDSPFILIVDDWNSPQVRIGTFRGIRNSKFRIASSIEIRTTQLDGSGPLTTDKESDWHRGYYMAVLDAN
jgi:hypothetical protein